MFSKHRRPNADVNPGRDGGGSNYNVCAGAQARRRKEGQGTVVVASDWGLRGPIRISALPTLNEGDIHNCGCPTNCLWPGQ